MKKLSKALVAGAASAAMIFTGLAGASSAFAVNVDASGNNINYTLQKAEGDTHDYKVFQLLKADVTADGTVSNPAKGDNLSDSFSLTIGDQTVTTVKDLAKALDGKDGDAALANELSKAITGGGADLGGTFVSGYYLIKDTTTNLGNKDTRNSFVLVTVGKSADPITVEKKRGTVTAEKKVKENVKDVTGKTDERVPDYELNAADTTAAGWNDVADYNIGDEVPFKLVGTLPERWDDYTSFQYVFTDTLGNGLTMTEDEKNALTVKDDKGTDIKNHFDVTLSGQTLIVKAKYDQTADPKLNGLKDIAGLTADSKIIVEYKATLNKNAVIGLAGNENKMTLTFSNNPNQGGEGDTSTTPEDKVVVFTYELDVTKVNGAKKDEDGNYTEKLKDAEFKLKNADDKWLTVDAAGKVTGWVNKEADASVLKSDADGKFKVIGLDSGTYSLKETKAPAGYNLLENEITLNLEATTVNNQAWDGTASSALISLKLNDVAGDTTTGIVSATVENNKGNTLPSTGGMGTTILYTVGALIVLAAGAGLAITLRRRNA